MSSGGVPRFVDLLGSSLISVVDATDAGERRGYIPGCTYYGYREGRKTSYMYGSQLQATVLLWESLVFTEEDLPRVYGVVPKGPGQLGHGFIGDCQVRMLQSCADMLLCLPLVH